MNSHTSKRSLVSQQKAPLIIGWREWMSLPELNIPAIKVKADTGARTSALHAVDIEPFDKDGVHCVRFVVEPLQRLHKPRITCEAPVVDERSVRNSGGQAEIRYVIEVLLQYKNRHKHIELTLTHRRDMRFRMLLGRSALVPDMLVDSDTSHRLGRFRRKELYLDKAGSGAS